MRRSRPLQETADAKRAKAWLSVALAKKLGVSEGALVKFKQGQGVAAVSVGIDPKLPDNVARVAAGDPTTSGLGAMFGAISVEKA